MKRILLLALVLVPLVLTSCTDDYYEDRPDFRDRIVGRYEVDEYSSTYAEHVLYSMYVEKDYSSRDGIYFRDLYLEGLSVRAYFDGQYVSIPLQVRDGYEIDGHGTYSRGEFDLYYRVTDLHSNSWTDHCETVAYPY